MSRALILAALLPLAACLRLEPAQRPLDAGCATYATARALMPRPLPDTALAQWVDANLDAAMTGACLSG